MTRLSRLTPPYALRQSALAVAAASLLALVSVGAASAQPAASQLNDAACFAIAAAGLTGKAVFIQPAPGQPPAVGDPELSVDKLMQIFDGSRSRPGSATVVCTLDKLSLDDFRKIKSATPRIKDELKKRDEKHKREVADTDALLKKLELEDKNASERLRGNEVSIRKIQELLTLCRLSPCTDPAMATATTAMLTRLQKENAEANLVVTANAPKRRDATIKKEELSKAGATIGAITSGLGPVLSSIDQKLSASPRPR